MSNRPFATLIVLACIPVFAQQEFGSITGTVIDPQGAAIARAKISLLSIRSAASQRETFTNDNGFFNFAGVQPGQYRLTVEATGFQSSQLDLAASVQTPVSLRIPLQLGSLNEKVTISATESRLNARDATIGNEFLGHQITQLPLEARNVLTLLSLQPGVVYLRENSPTERNTVNEPDPDSRNGSVNGGRSDQANVMLDGVDVNDQEKGLSFNSVVRITTESVQEFRVVTANPNAEQGRSSGAQVSIITRSGSNDLHGALFESHRNTLTSANDWFNNRAGIERPKLLRNVFGAAAGGPIVKNKLFIFGSYEGRRDASQTSISRVVPTSDYRNGIIRYRNNAGENVALTRQQFTALDPLGIGVNNAMLDFLKLYPMPNNSILGDGINWSGATFNSPINSTFDTFTARMDYQVSSRHSLFLRANYQDDRSDDEQQLPGQPPRSIRLNNSRGLAAGQNIVLTPNLLHSFRYGLTRAGLADSGWFTQPFWTLGPGIGSPYPSARDKGRITPTHNFVEDITWNQGRHTIGFGANIRLIENRRYSGENSYPFLNANTTYLVNRGSEIVPAGTATAYTTSYAQAAIVLMGIFPQSNAYYNWDKSGRLLGTGELVRRTFRSQDYEFYLQDSWRIKPNLTLTYGVRYGVNTPFYEANGNQVSPSIALSDWFDLRSANASIGIPSSATPKIGYDLAGPANQNRPGFYKTDWNNLSPRLAIAWNLGRTVIRGGASLLYDRVGAASSVTADLVGGFGLSTLLIPTSNSLRLQNIPRFQSVDAIPNGLMIPAPPFGLPQVFPGDGAAGSFAVQRASDLRLQTPYTAAFNFSIQHELSRDWTVEFAYVGRESRNNLVWSDVGAPVNLVDPTSGTNYYQSAQALMRQSGQSIAAIAPTPYWENIFPGFATTAGTMSQRYGASFTRANPGLSPEMRLSPTQVAYYLWTQSGTAPTRTLSSADLNCIPACSTYGKYAFYSDQFSSLSAWRSIAPSSYHSAQILLRKRFARGSQMDVNYTFSKSLDWGSGAERTMQTGGSYIINTWDAGQNKSVSDYDMTHQVNVNGIYEFPFGRGKRFASGINRGLDALIGGWQIAGIARWTSGLPVSITEGLGAPTNYYQAGFATLSGDVPATGTTKDGSGPNLFPDSAAAFTAFRQTWPGETGSRNRFRGDGIFTIDTGVSKSWKMPWSELHHLAFRWETFNLTNSVRFDVRSASLSDVSAANFGVYSRTISTPRVMQFLLRYQF